MPSRRVLLALVLLLIFLFAVAVIWVSRPGNTIISDRGFEGVVFSGESAADVLGFMLVNDRVEDAYWTPSKAEIRAVEEQLDLHVQEQLPALALQLAAYKRQYFGFVRDEKQLIMIVGFCEPVSRRWRQELVSQPDAAGCYFEAQYDVASGSFLYFLERSE